MEHKVALEESAARHKAHSMDWFREREALEENRQVAQQLSSNVGPQPTETRQEDRRGAEATSTGQPTPEATRRESWRGGIASVRSKRGREEREHLIRKRNWLEVEKRCLDADRMGAAVSEAAAHQVLLAPALAVRDPAGAGRAAPTAGAATLRAGLPLRGALRLRQRVEECGTAPPGGPRGRLWRRRTTNDQQMAPGSPGSCVRTAEWPVVVGFLVTASDARVGVKSPWIISSSCSSEYIDMKALIGLLLLVFGHGVSPVLHSLQYFYTGSSGLSTFPEFVAVGMLDGIQIDYYDSNTQRTVLKQDWIKQVTRDDPDYLERDTGVSQGAQQTFKAGVGILKQRFNQTGGAHLYQKMYGCEWDDEDGTTDGFRQYGYDGEDFIAWDMKTMTWVTPVPQAFATKQRWNQNKAQLQYRKHYIIKECVDWLKKYLDYGKSTLQRTGKSGLTIPIIIGLLVLLLVAAAAVVGVLLYKKRNASDKRHKPVGSDTSSENTEGQNPAPEAQPLTTG
ncbi:unnamed protein product [Boreogadus saida]